MLKIGSGAGFSGDRLEPAVELAKKVDLDYLVLECLAERTIAIAQMEKKKDKNKGYDPLLVDRLQALLTVLNEKRFRIVTNMGAANPIA
ncbi:MAG TPA: acyclic terpene utilization AtuA family protein, partial [Ureibacillus sp.]|nr:acyclic terpene utilization AtuA family protein [Ureibacillus sp.]